ncbi:MAG: phage shock protein operon transcriptional activator [Desulfomicrobium sp.]|nr:phage shock protein operon transcriptional activator [Pseudomonadota bacterium]MBV1713818.1 phage shock protein operon transcriptional activator [Desulfomicrobium sp.]MBU4572353.1 phage shock protein operon transcriptional activator [Pseudomonadota bacterium]MBU4594333.1 phage shock protein operon transcriptional activator [Pseudomonadota bacterium]MBV1719500.1 phage shock protein operon transcriptional activator [Desulfomicrobium sp.]
MAMSTTPIPALQDVIGQSDAFLNFQERLSRAAGIDRPVLIIGERGTGKELAAARLHFLSPRWQGPYVPLNCAAMPGSLLDSELFGHEAGAFTGAISRRKGYFERADNGTLFLDEIANLDQQAQSKLLRVAEYGTFDRVGGSSPVEVNVRLIGATNANLPQLAREGSFKKDLLDRLSFEVLAIPPLRQREGDVDLLVNHFTTRMAVGMGLDVRPEFSAQAMSALRSYQWPGNVRELRNVVERAVYRASGNTVTCIDFDPFGSDLETLHAGTPEVTATPAYPTCPVDLSIPLPEAVRNIEDAYLKIALERSRYNQKKAAGLMGLTYHQFRSLYRRLRREK